MEVTQGILICPQKKDAQVVVLVLHEGVHLQVFQALAVACILLDLPVRVAGDVHNTAALAGHFIQAMQRDGGKDLLHAPHVRDRLEEREVADILLAYQFFQLQELVRVIFGLLGQKGGFLADHPEERLALGSLLQADIAQVE